MISPDDLRLVGMRGLAVAIIGGQFDDGFSGLEVDRQIADDPSRLLAACVFGW